MEQKELDGLKKGDECELEVNSNSIAGLNCASRQLAVIATLVDARDVEVYGKIFKLYCFKMAEILTSIQYNPNIDGSMIRLYADEFKIIKKY